MVMLTIS